MQNDPMDWVSQKEEQRKEERSKSYFDIVEGKQQFVLLTHCAPLAQVYEGGKYRPAVEGEKGASIKGVCWVMQDDVIKQSKLPYTIVKAIRDLQQNPEWDFKLPFPHPLTLTAINAGSKEVEYSLSPSPRVVEIPQAILDELAKKPTPEEVVEKIKGGNVASPSSGKVIDYPTEEIRPEDIPF